MANDDSTHEQEAEARIDVTEPLSVSSANTLHRKHNDSISHLQGMLLNEWEAYHGSDTSGKPIIWNW